LGGWMHYALLIKAHKKYYDVEPRSIKYNVYMNLRKNWRVWDNPRLPEDEIRKLFDFVRSWDRYFVGDIGRFRHLYQEIFPVIMELKGKNITEIKLNEDLRRKISYVFNKVALGVSGDGKYRATDASKILHTILPELFVMWDAYIRESILGSKYPWYSTAWSSQPDGGFHYAYRFLPKMQAELMEAVRSCMHEKGFRYEDESINYIRSQCDGNTLAKLADEYNYVKYTLPKIRKDYLRVSWV